MCTERESCEGDGDNRREWAKTGQESGRLEKRRREKSRRENGS